MNWKDYAEEMGLSHDESHKLEQLLDRSPNSVELEMIGAMWSEHCSYKSSKHLLKTLPTQSQIDPERVVCSPGENAGAVSIGDGEILVFKIESHNHPSYVDPEQGAATGIGGILRDIFTMGARPIALMNGLFFGEWSHVKTPYLTKGVVKGIGGYGNCIGIPTVGGVSFFDKSYGKNILVNAMAVGLSKKLFYSKGEGVGNLLVYAGNLTGTDGVHGARASSSSFEEQGDVFDPIQVADPFVGKSIMEASLELLKTGKVIALQDMGAAGITCSTVEVASKGGYGVEIDLDQVPQRNSNLTPEEILLSESQERMLFVLEPKNLPIAQQVFERWGMYHGVIGKLTEDQFITVQHKGKIVAKLPVKMLTDDAPSYERQMQKLPKSSSVDITASHGIESLEHCLKQLVSSENFCSKDWIYEQYDQTIGGNTIQSTSSDLSIMRVGKDKAIAMSMNCPFAYCAVDPSGGAVIAVAECWRNLISTGAKPLAITNCLNFGDPTIPEIMEQFTQSVEGMKEACEKLDFPVVSGNVSFYNQTGKTAITPSPVIGGVGLIQPVSKRTQNWFHAGGKEIILIGKTHGHLENSGYAMYVLDKNGGEIPPIDLELERKTGEFLLTLSQIQSCGSVCQGGLITALFRMCIKNRVGIDLRLPQDIPPFEFLFGEDQSRYIIETADPDKVMELAENSSVPALKIGKIIPSFEIRVQGIVVPLLNLVETHKNSMQNYFKK